MGADLRVVQLVTSPVDPEGGEPIHFMVECANVGDEGTGPFVVRFGLDNQEHFELSVDTLAAGESQWMEWPHDGMSQGSHHIECQLDAEHAVPEPEERRNHQVRQFEVREIEFAPQDARHGDEYYDANALANAVIDAINSRFNTWLTLAVNAVEEWEIDAKKLVAEYDDSNAAVDVNPALMAFAQALVKYTPGASTAMGVIEDAGTFVGIIRTHMGDEHMGLAGARARLTKAIDELKKATGEAIREAIKGRDARLRAYLSAENPNSPLITIDYGSTEAEYIGHLADWLGFTEPDGSNTTEPIKQEMTEGFERVMWEVNRQLNREAGL